MLTYSQALDTVYSYIRYSKTLDTARVDRSHTMLHRTGNPQKKFPTIHVTGTKGKGSVCAMLAAVLRANGLRVGMYTSPHLHSLRERIQVDGKPISTDTFAALVERLRLHFQAVDGIGFPEVMTALALQHFADEMVDVAVIEVHVGGTFDATNVITPQCSVITRIDYDHTDFLGDTLTSIATHKAGIIKPGVPVVTAPQVKEALDVIRTQAEAKSAQLTVVGKDIPFTVVPASADGQEIALHGKPYRTNLRGIHQGENLAVAVSALQVVAQSLSLNDISAGLDAVNWPGRLEKVVDPTIDRSYLLDIAHNPAAADALAAYREAVYPGETWTIIYGSKGNKDIEDILTAIVREGDTLVLTQVHDPDTTDVNTLRGRVLSSGPENVTIATEPRLSAALTHAYGDRTCITGSIFVVAAARALLLGIEPETGSAR
jgi:dihydrofolate synthase/folylpolyglutamate synthase